MGGAACGGRRASLEEGRAIGHEILAWLTAEGAIVRGEIAGSIRRGKPEVGDVDLVVIRAEEVLGKPTLDDLLGPKWGWQKPKRKSDPPKAKKSGLWNGVQVDVNPIDEGGFGAMMMFATGNPQLNIVQRLKATQMGLKLNEKGVWRLTVPGAEKEPSAWVRIAGKTEEEVYAALELEFLTPERRG